MGLPNAYISKLETTAKHCYRHAAAAAGARAVILFLIGLFTPLYFHTLLLIFHILGVDISTHCFSFFI